MIEPRLFLCGGVEVAEGHALRNGRHVVRSSIYGPDANVNVEIEDVARAFPSNLSPRLRDFLDLAAYVYTADCSAKRGGRWGDDDTLEPWRRDFLLVVPMRDLEFWRDGPLTDLLRRTLNFLSDDDWKFDFRPFKPEHSEQVRFKFLGDEDWPFHQTDRVSLFSGGLDSLAGAVDRASRGQEVVLVSHRPVTIQNARQRDLFGAFRGRVSVPTLRIPVWLNKDGKFGREHTQRTRSFLYAVLGALVAESMQAGGISFYENGVVSLNLPVADEVLGARASRTTHPLALAYFEDLMRRVLERPSFVVDNPFLFKTKEDVVRIIAEAGHAELIGQTCSCAHQGHFRSRSQYHCGACSQCIDRRIAVLAAGLAEHDPSTDYRIDVFTGPRQDGYERGMAVDYVRHGMELAGLREHEIAHRFSKEINQAVRPFSHRGEVAERLIGLHRRHGEVVMRVLAEQMRGHSLDIVNCSIEPTSLLALTAGREHRHARWRAYAERIARALQEGVPRAYRSRKPKDEPELQETCDGLLHAANEVLAREFPFAQWGSVRTKPDWSDERQGLWVELKYVRSRSSFTKISEDIAADITKYGDSERRTLFVIYDPQHVVVDEANFIDQVEQHPGMMARFVR